MLEFNAEKHEYLLDGRIVTSPTQVLYKYSGLEKIPSGILENAKEFGKSIHDYLAAYNSDTLDQEIELPITEEYDMGAIVGGWHTKRMKQHYSFSLVEKPIASKKYQYGCTPDWVSENIVGDFKPRSTMSKNSVGVQLAANAQAAIENGLVDEKLVVLVSWHYDAWGNWKEKYWDFKKELNVWLCALTAHNHLINNKE
jgi:hypothetical protein